MPVQDFQGETFVAFTDISGFKEMMNDSKRAVQALNKFNQAGYSTLQDQENVNGFFISDCGVLFVRNNSLHSKQKLSELLNVLQKINRILLEDDIMLTTSIAFGPFSYHQKIEFLGIEKNPIYGNAYVAAFLNNENGKPKIQPGQCRIILNNLPDIVSYDIGRLKKKGSYYFFYWMVDNDFEIDKFETQYNDSYKLKYSGMLRALKRRNG